MKSNSILEGRFNNLVCSPLASGLSETHDAQGLHSHAAQHYERVLELAENRPSDVSCFAHWHRRS